MPGLPKEINSPFGNKPGSLPSPVPKDGTSSEVMAGNAEAADSLEPSPEGVSPEESVSREVASSGAMPVQESAPVVPGAPVVPDSAEALLAQWDEEDAAAEAAPVEGGKGPEGFASIKEQFSEAGMRLRKSFAVTSPENEQVIKESGLFDDVKQDKDGWQVKRKGQKKWSKLDRDGYQLVTDTLDFARDAFEMVVEGGTEIAGTIAGGLASGGTASIPANIASGAAGAIAAKTAGDAMSQHFLGIKQDPERNLLAETALASTFGAGFGWMGASMARRAATRKFARVEGDKSVRAVVDKVSETMENITEVQNSGIKLDKNFKVDPNVAAGGADPELKATAKYVSDTDGYRNFFNQMGDQLTTAYDSLTGAVANFAGKNTDNIGRDFVLTTKDVRKAEGRLIGDFVQFADKATRGKRQAAPMTFQTLSGFVEELGDAKGKITIESAIENFGVSRESATQLVAKINKARQMSKRGQMSVDTSKILYDDLSKTIGRMSPAEWSSANGKAIIDLKNAVRDDWVDMVENVLPDGQKGSFVKSRARYSELMNAHRSLGNLLKGESISRDVLTQKLFEGTKANEFMTSAKTMIQETNPELWGDLSREYFSKLQRLATEEVGETGSKTVNWKSMGKKWGKLDPRVKKELSEASGFGEKGVSALFELGRKYQNADVGFMAKESSQSAIKRGAKAAIQSFLGGGAAKASGAVSMLEGVGKDQALMKWLQSGGNMEKITRELKGLSPSAKKSFQTFTDSVYDWVPDPITKGAQQFGKTETRRSAEEASAGE